MQLRFDGKFGFPGGFVDPGETVLEAVNREMFEEMNIDPKLVTITKEDFLASSIHEKKDDKFGKNYDKIKGFTFAKQIDEITFNKIEESSRKAEHFGTEVSLTLFLREISMIQFLSFFFSQNLGTVRAPVHLWREVDGFPRFLQNVFAGNALSQLLLLIYKTNILTETEILDAYNMHDCKSK